MTGSLNSGLLPEEDTTTMHTFDTIIVISIACCIGFVPAIYVKKDPILAIGYFVASTIGAFAGSHLVLRKFTQFDKPGIVFGGIGKNGQFGADIHQNPLLYSIHSNDQLLRNDLFAADFREGDRITKTEADRQTGADANRIPGDTSGFPPQRGRCLTATAHSLYRRLLIPI